VGLNPVNANELFKNYTFNSGLKMLLLDFVLFTLLGMYLDAIMPRKFGQRRSCLFPCRRLQPTYWDCFDGICPRKGDRLY